MLLVQEFSLELRRTVPFGPGAPREITVSSLDATAQFGVAVRAGVEGDRLVLHLADLVSPLTDAERLRLTVAAESPIQPRSAQALDALAADIDPLLRLAVSVAVTGAVDSVCPVIQLPIVVGGSVTVHDIAVRTHRADDGDVIVVGVRLATDDKVVGAGDPATLGNPFSGTALDTYARFHEAMFRKVVRQAQASGALEAAARKVHTDLRVDGADAQLAPNELKLILDMRLVDACGFLINTIDVHARVTVTFLFTVFEDQVFVSHSTDYDLDNLDVAICVIVELLQLHFFGAIVSVIDLISQLIRFAPLLSGDDGGEPFDVFSAVFDPRKPVPGTEVLPKVEAVQALVREDRLEALGTLTLRPDDINTYIYAQFARRSLQLGGAPTPISGAHVQLVDQDHPSPPGDDAHPPALGTTTTTFGDTVTDRTVTFEPPASDEILAQDTADNHGRVQFVLQPADLHSIAGTVVTTVRSENLKTDSVHQTTSRRALTEKLPDIYFRVTPPGGVTFDTRAHDSGFVLNLRSRRIGTAAVPLTFLTGKQGPDTHQ